MPRSTPTPPPRCMLCYSCWRGSPSATSLPPRWVRWRRDGALGQAGALGLRAQSRMSRAQIAHCQRCCACKEPLAVVLAVSLDRPPLLLGIKQHARHAPALQTCPPLRRLVSHSHAPKTDLPLPLCPSPSASPPRPLQFLSIHGPALLLDLPPTLYRPQLEPYMAALMRHCLEDPATLQVFVCVCACVCTLLALRVVAGVGEPGHCRLPLPPGSHGSPRSGLSCRGWRCGTAAAGCCHTLVQGDESLRCCPYPRPSMPSHPTPPHPSPPNPQTGGHGG